MRSRVPQLVACAFAFVVCACHRGRAAQGPSFVVTVSMEGASPADAEQMGTAIERQCAQVPRVARLTGTARDGSATVRVEMERGTEPDADLVAITDAVKRAGPTLPVEASPPVVSRAAGAVVVRHVLRSEMLPLSAVTGQEQASWATKAAQVAGVGVVEECGAMEPRVLVEVDAAALAGTGVTLAVQAREGVRVGTFSGAQSQAVPVVLRAKGGPGELYVKGTAGRVPLSALVSTKSEPVESVLLHEGQLPVIGVSVQTGDVKALEKAFRAPEGMQYRVIPTP